MLSVVSGGAGGIRTLARPLQAYNGLANRRLQPLGHSSMSADMPDAGASRKQQFEIKPLRSGDTGALRTFRANGRCPATPIQVHLGRDLLTARSIESQGVDSMPHPGRIDLARIPVPAAEHDAGTGRSAPVRSDSAKCRNFGDLSPAFCPGWASNARERSAAALFADLGLHPLTLL